MQLKFLALTSLAAGYAVAQQSLVQALNGTAQLSNLTGLIAANPQLVAALGNLTNITLFAPSNAAITTLLNNSAVTAALQADPNLLGAILNYHVLNGTYQTFSANTSTFARTALMNSQYANVTGGQRVEVRNTTVYSGLRSNSSIVNAAVNFTGGVIHIVDRVLTLPTSISATATAFNLTSFYGALNATQLIPTVNGLRDVTVFVPNNAAFSAIGSALPNLTMQQIIGLLDYHIINGTVAYSTLLRNESIPTLNGASVNVSIHSNGGVFVNNARVVIPNVLVANGVIHVIDQILNPNNTAASTNATAGTPAFSGASSVTNAPYTSGQPTPTSSINTAAVASSAAGGSGSSSSSAAGAWMPAPTDLGVAALGGLALLMQL